MSNILEKSELQICCNLKGIEVLIPDSTHYETSKFLQVQTGNIVVRNGPLANHPFTLRKEL